MKGLFFPPFTLAILLVTAGAALCSGCYTLKQGTAMLGYLNRAVPIEDLAAPGASAENRAFAEQVMDIRRFAMRELGLKESKNYTTYVEIDRDYLAAVVSACAKDSFTRYEWWFPVVGSVPYKGFFDVEDARRERASLEKKDLDVWVRGVDAFSTLGWFNDPLYSYMKYYSLSDLAELIIHELVHATVFVKNRVQFNEELAEFIGAEGARLYLERGRDGAAKDKGESPDTDAGADAEADSAAFIVFIQGLIAELDTMYQNAGLTREEKLRHKEEIISRSQAEFSAAYDRIFKTENYRSFGALKINNAYLELYRLYYEGGGWFKDLYEKSGRDLRAYISAAKTLTGRDDPRAEFARVLGID